MGAMVNECTVQIQLRISNQSQDDAFEQKIRNIIEEKAADSQSVDFLPPSNTNDSEEDIRNRGYWGYILKDDEQVYFAGFSPDDERSTLLLGHAVLKRGEVDDCISSAVDFMNGCIGVSDAATAEVMKISGYFEDLAHTSIVSDLLNNSKIPSGIKMDKPERSAIEYEGELEEGEFRVALRYETGRNIKTKKRALAITLTVQSQDSDIGIAEFANDRKVSALIDEIVKGAAEGIKAN